MSATEMAKLKGILEGTVPVGPGLDLNRGINLQRDADWEQRALKAYKLLHPGNKDEAIDMAYLSGPTTLYGHQIGGPAQWDTAVRMATRGIAGKRGAYTLARGGIMKYSASNLFRKEPGSERDQQTYPKLDR